MSKENESPCIEYVKRFQEYLDRFNDAGIRHYELINLYLDARDDAYNSRDYSRTYSHLSSLGDLIFALLEERVRERVAESKRKIAGLRGQL